MSFICSSRGLSFRFFTIFPKAEAAIHIRFGCFFDWTAAQVAARRIGRAGRLGFFVGVRRRGQKLDDVAEALLPVGLGHADNGAQRMRAGVVARICRTRREHHRNALEPRRRFAVRADIVAGHPLALDFCDQQGRRALAENIARFLRVGYGDDVVAFARQKALERFADAGFGVQRQNQGPQGVGVALDGDFLRGPGLRRGAFRRWRR